MNMENLIDFLIAHQFLTSMIVLPVALLLNIYLGWAIADFQGGYDRNRFFLGFKKGIAVYISIGSLSMIAQVIHIAELDLRPTMALIVYTVMVRYILQAVKKIQSIMDFDGSKLIINDLTVEKVKDEPVGSE